MPILAGDDPADLAAAARRLAEGGLVGLPTETVYGLAARADVDAAVAAIFTAKGRPSDHPLIVHVASLADADAFAAAMPPAARRLAEAFWPGPVTVIVPRRAGVAEAAAAGLSTVGLRCPAHPVAQALLAACAAQGVAGLAGPSANRFGRVSPTTAQHVHAEFGDDLLVIDGGPCDVGIESTIVDCSRGAPVLLRPGAITRDQIEAACGEPLRDRRDLAAPDPRASGTLAAHYAPDARVRLMDARALQAALDVLGAQAAHLAVWARTELRTASSGVLRRRMPGDAGDAARELFAVLRDFDARGVRLIWVETPPDTPEWEGVRDRLQRAAAA